MKILITGCTGFIGQNLMPILEQECPQIEILTLNRDLLKAKKMYAYANVKHVSASDWNAVIQFNPNLVFHLAAFSTSSNNQEVIEPLIASNITYGVELLGTLSRCNDLKLFVNTGTFAEYRLGVKHFNSAYLYAATKTAFRSFLHYYSELKGYKYITAVPYTVYGGKPTIKRLMDYLLESIDAQQPVEMTFGEQVLDFIHVNDVTSFFIHIIHHIEHYFQLHNGEDFHLGTGRGVTVREVAALIEHITGKQCNIHWGAKAYRERDTMYAVAPIAQNAALTGWSTHINIEYGITQYVNSFKNNG